MNNAGTLDTDTRLLVSLRTLSLQLDADRSTVRRWLRDGGVAAVVVGRGRNAAVRYDAEAVRAWIDSRRARTA